MIAEQRTRTVVHKEWTIPSPAHHTDVQSAYAVALSRQEQEPGRTSDIEFRTEDDLLVLGYTTEASDGAHGRVCRDIELDRDEQQRRAEFATAAVQRVRQLAIQWSAAPTGTLRQEVAAELHRTLDNPGDETAAPSTPPDWERQARSAHAAIARVREAAASWNSFVNHCKFEIREALGPYAAAPLESGGPLPAGSLADLPYAQRTETIRERYTAFAYNGEHPADRERDTAIGHLLDIVENQAERLSLARQALAGDGYFTAAELSDDVAPRITELLIHLRGRVEAAEAAVARARELAASWAEHRYVGLGLTVGRDAMLTQARDALIHALGGEQ